MSDPVCPYCRMAFDEASPPKIFCTACGMPHHEDCYRENGGCTVFGCKCAPADDPKLQVSQSDLSAVSVAAQPYAPVPQQYAHAAPQSGQAIPSLTVGRWVCHKPPPLRPRKPQRPAALSRLSPASIRMPRRFWRPHKSRTTYIVLGIFLGALGVHNFYAGYMGRAVGQLCLTVLTLGYLGMISWIWAIIEICIVEKDSTGLSFS